MADKAKWARRVEGWTASGLTSTEYCAGQPFSASALRYWRTRLQKSAGVKPARSVRIAHVVRDEARSSTPVEAAPVVIEAGGLRILVPPTADRDGLRLVLDVLRDLAAGAR